MRVDPVTRYADYGGKSIAYQRFGHGEQRLLQINAVPGHLELIWLDPAFTDALERFAEASEVILFEQLGLGMSDPVDHRPTIEEQADEIGAVMDAAGWESATICGVLSTCLAAVVFAAHHPERVDRLSLLGPVRAGMALGAGVRARRMGERPAGRGGRPGVREAIAAWGSGQSLAIFTPDLANPRSLRRWGVLERASASPQMAQAMYDLIGERRHPGRAPRRPGSLAWSCGRTAIFLPEAVTRHVAALLPNARFVQLPRITDISVYFSTYQRAVEEFMLGAAPEHDEARALMTVLFTDIVGSTEQAARWGDSRWRSLLVEHEQVVRNAVEAADGQVVKFIGDGSLSTFTGPARAIRCAERIRDAVQELDIELRAGLHTGECDRIGDDIAGLAVHIAARVSAQAGAGEIWVSRTIRDLVAGSGIELSSRGEHELKGVEGTWELFEVGEVTAPMPAPEPEARAARRRQAGPRRGEAHSAPAACWQPDDNVAALERLTSAQAGPLTNRPNFGTFMRF